MEKMKNNKSHNELTIEESKEEEKEKKGFEEAADKHFDFEKAVKELRSLPAWKSMIKKLKSIDE